MPDMHFDLSAKSDDYSQHDDKNMNEEEDAEGSFTSIQNVEAQVGLHSSLSLKSLWGSIVSVHASFGLLKKTLPMFGFQYRVGTP